MTEIDILMIVAALLTVSVFISLLVAHCIHFADHDDNMDDDGDWK